MTGKREMMSESSGGFDDLLGAWEAPSSSGVSFEAGAGRSEPSIWRMQLPAAPDAAQVMLEEKRVALRRSEADLAEAQRRLDRFDRGVSFAAPAGPEAELREWLNAIESPVSFGPLESRRKEAEKRETHRQWQGFLGRVREILSHYALVETEIGGMLVGRTAVGWSGDFDTRWETNATLQSMELHRQSVHLALESRIALVRLLSVIGAGAAKLALRLTVPGAQLLVLPAAWKFVRDVLKAKDEW